MLYFDTSYLVRLYTKDSGWEKVRALAITGSLSCCIHGQAETIAAFHRKFREGVLTRKELGTLLTEFNKDSNAGAFRWLPLSPAVVDRVGSTFARLPDAVPLRAADAIHLACSADAGFSRIYSNDTRLLTAASHFGLAGENII
ncbi:MAG TPA: type II toxin-antitoxin system VapC family toxin [Verrucomicrobiae bacterium]|jgi:predicted nucleic acid-binding protein|nr:type II toxin-antitoxin system VapC family toxin [Verrucomicrobiae bacterium]